MGVEALSSAFRQDPQPLSAVSFPLMLDSKRSADREGKVTSQSNTKILRFIIYL
jgi:hypothetical protein